MRTVYVVWTQALYDLHDVRERCGHVGIQDSAQVDVQLAGCDEAATDKTFNCLHIVLGLISSSHHKTPARQKGWLKREQH